jgi:hypothetical protein
MAPRTRDYPIDDLRQMEELASAVRQDIVDAVVGMGRCTVRELAEALGRPMDGLYYHVRRLVEAELLREERSASGEGDTVLVSPTRGVMRLVYDPPSPGRHKVLRRIVGAVLRSAERDFADALGTARAHCSGRLRNLNVSRQRPWLTASDLAELNALLAQAQAICARPRTPDSSESYSMHSFTFVMAPLEPQPVRRDPDAASRGRARQKRRSSGTVALAALLALVIGCAGDRLESNGDFTVRALPPVGDTLRWTIEGEMPPERVVVPTPDVQIANLDNAGAEPIGRIGHLVGGHDGSTILHDAAANRIVRYGPDGRVAGEIGRAGGGPGEYGIVFGMALEPDDDLVVWDGSGSRLGWFGPDGSFRNQRVIPATGRSGTDGLFADTTGTLYLRASLPSPGSTDDARVQGVVRLDAAGPQDSIQFPRRVELVSPLRAQLPNGTVIYGRTIPFLPRDHYGITGAGVLVVAPSSMHALHFVSPDGRAPRTVSHPLARLPVPDAERERVRAQLEAEMREVDPEWNWSGPEIPTMHPTHEGLTVDRVGRLWLRRLDPAGAGVVPDHVPYDVYASDGAPIARVHLPARARFATATATHFWWVRRDSLDVPFVERGSLHLPAPVPLPANP